ncbi:MAG TPA: hypothetical protein VFQ67_11135 [Allosphingosinicella sp.]|jgi:hypothetical protein|nr:hypothetical protein [Allosphingosinicella sp.]
MQIDPPAGAVRFEEALAAEQVWPRRFANRVTDEYRRFLYLAATAGFEVTPSKAVDEAWHLHLTSPHYREILCGRILGRPLDHRPGTGDPEDEARYRAQYEETLALYERVFGARPPRDIWPRAGDEEESEEPETTRRRWPMIARRLAAASLVGSAASLPAGAPVAAAVLGGAALLFFLFSQPTVAFARGGGGTAGCGGSCGGSWSSGSDGAAGCGSSCSGSCGGGGCGGGCGGGGD